MKRNVHYLFIFILLFGISVAKAGNPDRQGEAGAYELLMNPWAVGAGLNGLNTASASGVESMRMNIAGLSRIGKGQLGLTTSQIYSGSGLTLNAMALALKMGKSGALGIGINSLTFGEIPITTVDFPEGTGGTFKPNFSNISLSYSYMYENKISVGLLVRGISESISDVSATGFSIDAGVQYVAGANQNFRLGIALKNIGSPMAFGGQGLAVALSNQDPSQNQYNLTYTYRAQGFELPSTLDIGVSYDYYIGDPENKTFIRGVGNFTSNAFSRDEVGLGIEFNFIDRLALRGSYKGPLNTGTTVFGDDIHTGLAGGFTYRQPLNEAKTNDVSFDYSYRATNPYKGTHNFTIRYNW